MSKRGSEIVVVGHDSIDMGGLTAELDADGWAVSEHDPSNGGDVLTEAADAVVIVDAPPAQDGLEVFEKIRGTDPVVPIVLVGSEPSPDRIQTALQTGVTDYFQETQSEEILRAKLRAHLAAPQLDGAVTSSQWRDIASSLSHDAKNPMNVVMGRLELLELDGEHIEAVDRSLDRVLTLLDEISTIGTCSRLLRERESVGIDAVANEVWRTMETGEATLQVDTERIISADRNLLKILFERILENAVVHAGEDVAVTVGATADTFYIEDDGPGIAEDDQETVFEQGYGTTRDGEGYGLFIVERIVRSHGWDVKIAAGNAGGCRVVVSRTEFSDVGKPV